MARAAAAPPATASEPPSQKSFCTSTMISARIEPTVSSGPGRRDGSVRVLEPNVHYQPVILGAVPAGPAAGLVADVGGRAIGDADELAERRRGHRVRVPRRRPDLGG